MAENEEQQQKSKGGMATLILMAVIGIAAPAAGFVTPMLLVGRSTSDTKAKKLDDDKNLSVIPFDAVSVNIATNRLTRYLRVKIALVVHKDDEYEATQRIEKKKLFLKNWLITYLADQTLEDVTGAAGVNRIRRELIDQFNLILYPDDVEKIRDVLFEEFLIQ